MPDLAVNDLVQSIHVNTAGAQTALNIRHWLVTGITGLSASYQNAADQMDATLGPLYKAVMATAAFYYGTGVKRLAPVPVTDWFFSTANGVNGIVAGDLLPRQTAGIIQFRTGVAGRANRGRMYLPFPSETDNDALSVPTAGYITAAGAIGTFFRSILTITTAGGTADLIPVIYHRVAGTFTSVNVATVEPYWASQRRRGSFGAVNFPPF